MSSRSRLALPAPAPVRGWKGGPAAATSALRRLRPVAPRQRHRLRRPPGRRCIRTRRSEAFTDAGLSPEGFAALNPVPYGAVGCKEGRVQTIDTLVCEYGDTATLTRGETALLEHWGREGGHTGVALHNKLTLLGRLRSRAPRSERQGDQPGHRHVQEALMAPGAPGNSPRNPRTGSEPPTARPIALARRERRQRFLGGDARGAPAAGGAARSGSLARRRPRARRGRCRPRRRPPSSSSAPRRRSAGAPPTWRAKVVRALRKGEPPVGGRLDLHGRVPSPRSPGRWNGSSPRRDPRRARRPGDPRPRPGLGRGHAVLRPAVWDWLGRSAAARVRGDGLCDGRGRVTAATGATVVLLRRPGR